MVAKRLVALCLHLQSLGIGLVLGLYFVVALRQLADHEQNMISKEEVKHIAGLARIKLEPGQVEKYQRELSAILEFVKKLPLFYISHMI